MKNISVFLISLVIGLTAVLVFEYNLHMIKYPTANQLPTFHFSMDKAPEESLRGEITSLTGNINWLSRTSTQPEQLKSPRQIQQGEELETKDGSSLKMEFPEVAAIELVENTLVDITQTLPVNLVIKQIQGSAVYIKTGSKVPLSIRGLDLLTNIEKGSSKIKVDKDNNMITIDVISGEDTIAYNDTNYTSRIIYLTQDQEFVFNNDSKEYKIR